ncbi:MAG: DUF3327 domain-containing protein, partial [Candidatus Latescibacteria bacterium]|nr:DUF3327 domain-containing protein [Candidatus Latescibacterota bacterium]
ALSVFWKELETNGAPLIEPGPRGGDHVLVTFVWRADSELDNVVLVTGLEDFINIGKNQLGRLGDTNLWYKTYSAHNDIRTVYRFSPNDNLVPLTEEPDMAARIANWRRDPFNTNTFVFPAEVDGIVEKEYIRSVLELPGAPEQVYVAARDGIPKGTLNTYRFSSTVLRNDRLISVYTPPGYDEKRTYPLTVFVDRYAYLSLIPTPTILDNMIKEKVIPPMVAVFVGIPTEARTRELACYPAFGYFVANELLDWVRQNHNVTTEPQETIIAGSSQGAVAATYIGIRHPDVYGKVLSQSGLFWYKPNQDPEYEWLTRYIAGQPKNETRFHVEAGLLERGAISADGPSILVANRHLRTMLQAKGFTFSYEEFSGGHDYVCWRGTLSNGLKVLAGKVEDVQDLEMETPWAPIPE